MFCPNKLAIYMSCLRLMYQGRILKKGIDGNVTEKIKKLYEFESLIYEAETLPLNIERYSSELFTAVIFKKKFNYKICVKGNRLINRKAYTFLILNICLFTDFLEIKQFSSSIIICGKFYVSHKIKLLIKRLSGSIYREIKSGKVYIKLNFPKTGKKSADFESAFYMLQNPLSPINLYFPD